MDDDPAFDDLLDRIPGWDRMNEYQLVNALGYEMAKDALEECLRILENPEAVPQT